MAALIVSPWRRDAATLHEQTDRLRRDLIGAWVPVRSGQWHPRRRSAVRWLVCAGPLLDRPTRRWWWTDARWTGSLPNWGAHLMRWRHDVTSPSSRLIEVDPVSNQPRPSALLPMRRPS
jgi:hypothetical protein